MSYRFVDSFWAGPSCSKAPLLSVQWMNSWWWTEELSETCSRVSWQNKSVKLVHLVGFIIRNLHKFVEWKMTAHCLPDVNLRNFTYFAFLVIDDRHIWSSSSQCDFLFRNVLNLVKYSDMLNISAFCNASYVYSEQSLQYYLSKLWSAVCFSLQNSPYNCSTPWSTWRVVVRYHAFLILALDNC